MHGVLTHAERALTEKGQSNAVNQMRHHFQQATEPALRAAVEELTRRKVVASISGNHTESDIASELFILDEPL